MNVRSVIPGAATRHFRKLSNGLRGAGGGAVVGSKFFQLRGRHAGTDVGDGGFNASGGYVR